MKRSSVVAFAMVGGLAAVSLAVAQTKSEGAKPEETEVWKPAVPVVAPAQDVGGVPADAIILFDGKNLDQWISALDKSPAG